MNWFFIKIGLTLLCAVLSGFFYHCGGLGKDKSEEGWIPLFLRQSWMRDWVIPAFSLVILFTWWKPNVWWGYLLSIPAYGIMGGALSTYWDWLCGEDNFFIHGFFVGLSFFPFYWAGLHWYMILANAIVSGLLMWWLCVRTGKAWLEENGRGFIAAITRLLLR
jgi:hypothetical protein